MGDFFSRTLTGRRGTCAGLLLFVLASSLIARADSLTVTDQAALDGNYGLRVAFRDEHFADETWVAIGPDKGLNHETALQGGFLMDLEGLFASGRAPSRLDRLSPKHICFLSLAEHLDDPSGANVRLFLEQGKKRTWRIGVLLWDDARGAWLRAAVGYPVPLELATTPARLDFEWAAETVSGAHDGYFRLFHTVDEQTILLLEITSLASASQAVSYMQVGVIDAGHRHKSISGDLDLDAFELRRIPSTD